MHISSQYIETLAVSLGGGGGGLGGGVKMLTCHIWRSLSPLCGMSHLAVGISHLAVEIFSKWHVTPSSGNLFEVACHT